MPLFRKFAGFFKAAGLSIRRLLLGGAAAVYIEDVFSTWLYTGTASTQTITNGIGLSTNGGLVWIKNRGGVNYHVLTNTISGVNKQLATNAADGEGGLTDNVTAFNTTGFTLGTDVDNAWVNGSGRIYVSWTFREQPKFFDIVTWTGTGANRTIAHALGSVPGSIFVKRTDTTGAWQVYHRSLANTDYLVLNTTAASATGATIWNSTTATSSVFSVGTDATVNASGGTYVAYVFAHDAGGFGLTGTDNVISCGTFTTDGSGNATVNLGYEPQWCLLKASGIADGWKMLDNMRGWLTNNGTGLDANLAPNTTAAEAYVNGPVQPRSTGFEAVGASASRAYIYIAIRRGPMKVPTSGTSVFSSIARSGTGATAQVTGVGFPADLVIGKPRTGFNVGTAAFDRLRGTAKYLAPSWTDAEISDSTMITSFNMDGVSLGADTVQKYFNGSGGTYINWFFKRAPGFFDEVCYTGNGTTQNIKHNLGALPEFILTKRMDAASSLGWILSVKQYYASSPWDRQGRLNLTNGLGGGGVYTPAESHSTTQYPMGSASADLNASGGTYIAYLFATLAGVSKVGIYTGTGTTNQIDCGFTAGARFVLIKRADETPGGDTYVWDTARGIIAGNDPYLLLNSTAAEATATDYIDPYSPGFELSSTAPAALNASGGTYIFLAIA